MLLKAFLEMKMLIIRAVQQIQASGERLLTEQQMGDFEAFMMHVYKDCCKGGVDRQYKPMVESMQALKLLVCGGESNTCEAKANNVLLHGSSQGIDGTTQAGAAEGCHPAAKKEQRVGVEVQSSHTAKAEVLDGTNPGCGSLERPKAQRLKRKLDEVLKHLGSGCEILDEANDISGN